MAIAAKPEVEAELRSLCDAADYSAAAAQAISAYGAEILGFLLTLVRDRDAAEDIFSQFCEDLWLGMPTFRWDSSARTFAYTLARHAAYRWLRKPAERRKVPLSRSPELTAIEQEVRSQTRPYLKTENKERLARIRERLSPEDQALLVLRLDRGMSWTDTARVLMDPANAASGDDGEDGDDAAIARKAASLRQRFSRIKEEIRRIAAQEQWDETS